MQKFNVFSVCLRRAGHIEKISCRTIEGIRYFDIVFVKKIVPEFLLVNDFFCFGNFFIGGMLCVQNFDV